MYKLLQYNVVVFIWFYFTSNCMNIKKYHSNKSQCPIAHALDIMWDKWTLLVLRDIVLMNKHEFNEFLSMKEKIATNILTDRLKKLWEFGMIDSIPYPNNKKKKLYHLTDKWIDIIPMIVEMIAWSGRNLPDVYQWEELEFFKHQSQNAKDMLIKQAQEWNKNNLIDK